MSAASERRGPLIDSSFPDRRASTGRLRDLDCALTPDDLPAIWLLGATGSASASPALLRALMQKEVEIRLHALYSLARIRDKEATPALLRALSDRGCLEDAGILQIQMDFGLPEIVALNKASMVRPYELLPFSCVRDGAVYALGQGGDPQATNALLSLLSDGKASIRFAAVLALAHYPEKRIVAVFIEKLHDKESGIVVAAITALNCMKAMEAVDPLRALASETKDELVKKLAEGAIDALTKPSTTTPRPAKKRMPIEPKQGRPSQRKNR